MCLPVVEIEGKGDVTARLRSYSCSGTVTNAQSRKSMTRRTPGVNEMSLTPSTPFGPPFDHDDADIILRSSDRVDFHVYQAILSISSPFFKSMFSLPQPNSSGAAPGSKDSVVDLPENSRTIATILTFIYPVVSAAPEPESLDDMMDAFVAAKKYDMAIVSQRLNQTFAESEIVQGDPIAAFSAAYSQELGEVCRIAAKASLKCRMNLNNIADKLQYMNGPAFYQLYKYHRACSTSAAQAVSGTRIDWITTEHSTWLHLADGGSCRSACPSHGYRVSSQYWSASPPFHDFITRARNVLLEHPCPEAVTGHQFLDPSYKVNACDRCRITSLGLPEFSWFLGKEIERCISMVRHDSFHLLPSAILNDFYRRLS